MVGSTWGAEEIHCQGESKAETSGQRRRSCENGLPTPGPLNISKPLPEIPPLLRLFTLRVPSAAPISPFTSDLSHQLHQKRCYANAEQGQNRHWNENYVGATDCVGKKAEWQATEQLGKLKS